MTVPNLPIWELPATSGLVSNTRGSNTSTDAITMTARYSSPRASADPALAMRVIAERTAIGGIPSNPTITWDSGWIGNATVNVLPVGLNSHQAVYANGRAYIIGGQDSSNVLHAEVWSASFNNGAVGTWRREQDFPYPVAGHSACAVAMNMSAPTQMSFIYSVGGGVALNPLTPGYATVTANGWYAPINADGSLGAWQQMLVPLGVTVPGDAPRAFGALIQIGWNTLADAPYFGLPIIAFSGGTNTNSASVGNGMYATTGAQTTFFTTTLNQDGSMWETFWQQNGAMPAGVYGHSAYFDPPNQWIINFGGSNGTSALASAYWTTWNSLAPQAAVSWTTNATSLPAARSGAALVFTPTWDNTNKGRVILLGGTSGANLPMTTGLYASSIFAASNSAIVAASWTAFTNALPAALVCLSACGVMEARTGTIPGVHQIAVFGGTNGSNVAVTTVDTASASPPLATTNYGAWVSGTGSALTSGNLGTGGVLTDNQDGTIDCTVVYGGVGQAILSSFSDGDQAQISVQFLDVAGGDASPAAYTLFGVGQPPTISSIVPANAATPANGQPPCSFFFNSGTGGGPQYTWDLQIKQSTTLIFDSGTRYDFTNQISPLTIAPLLVPSTAYTLIITITSTDPPYPSSTATATSTTTFTTTAFSAPSAPGGFSATPNNTAALVALTWSSVVGASYYRIYHRRTGITPWTLLQDNVATTSFNAMDHIALGVAYDFAVSAVNSTPAESALSSIDSNNTIRMPDLGPYNYSGYIHVAGAGTTYGVPVVYQTIDMTSPGYMETQAAAQLFGFGQAAPVVRYAQLDYDTFTPKVFLNDLTPATFKSLLALIAQVRLGGVAFWRDAMGGMITVAFSNPNIQFVDPSTPSNSLVIYPPSYREVWLAMMEVADTIGPYVSSGSAQGYLTLVNGRRPPLDTSERLL